MRTEPKVYRTPAIPEKKELGGGVSFTQKVLAVKE